MASSGDECFFCGDSTMYPQNIWPLTDSAHSQICHLCSLTLERGTFCDMFHGHEEGWTNCHDCGKLVHYGCIMAFNSYEINENGITCKKCITKRSPEATQLGASNIQASQLGASNIQATHASNIQATHLGASNIQAIHVGAASIQGTDVGASNIQATHVGASFPMVDSEGWSELENYGSFTELLTGGGAFLAEPGRTNALNDDVNNSDEVTIEGNLNISEPSNSDLLFLFEKQLTPTDCDIKAARFLVPKKYAEEFFPEVVGSHSMPFPIEDTQARSWPLTFRSWTNRSSRKYVLDHTKECIQTMQWNAGDILKFYSNADGKMIIELEKTRVATSVSNVTVPGDGTSNS